MPELSIIVRTKNEERWIGHCLKMIFKQDFQGFEVILVDNKSTDHTLVIAKRFPIKTIISIDEFLPGLALNMGIKESTGKYIVCLSAHCVPKDTNWLSNLYRNFEDNDKVAGVYGRQLPVRFTDAVDKRDLLIVFGQDKRIQEKDYFFHNANSMLRRDIWESFPFDEQVTNIEDRVWGKQIISEGYNIVYEPEAAVFHHHGLHQGNRPERAKGVISVIQRVDDNIVNELPESLRPERVRIDAVIPVQGTLEPDSREEKLLLDVIDSLKQAKYLDDIYIVGENNTVAEQCGIGFIDRTDLPNADQLSLNELMCEVLQFIEKREDFPEALIYVNYDYPFRPEGLFDDLIQEAQYQGYDTVFPSMVDYGHYWILNQDGEYKESDPSLKSRQEREPVYRALYGLGCLSSSWLVRSGIMIGGKVGILPLERFRFSLRMREPDTELFYTMLKTDDD